ncbi:lamin tail-like protein [Lutibacter oceani]|uniref:Lamin tail-like protein n=1 Tax=Lutibacter oceani TaxID=1853311 RepID=A0A3D9S2C4_9FLAO|nr:DUF5689 domain-containing protein [Lutibacter oceani]REE83456.1 lamin tail-like protein [Lutibacter oceani]
MKLYKKLKLTLQILAVFSIFLSCVKDNGFSTPTVDCNEPSISVTNTIAQVKDMYTFGGATIIETDVVIEGYVVSSDKSGNIYKTISIQDKPENPTSAIKISIDETDIYTKYNVGRKIYIKLKGLAVGYSFGSIQIGKAVGTELARIPSLELNNYIVRSCEVAEITPKLVTINELNEDMLEMLIEIENVQFKESELGSSYANIDNTSTVNRVLENFNSNCNLLDEVIVRNSGFADFKSQLLPEGKGNIVAIFSNYYEDYQLYIRETEDVKFTEERCNYTNAFTPTLSIAEVKEMYNEDMVEFGVNNNYIIEGYIISSDKDGNFKERLIIQDTSENPTAGIQLLIEQENIFENFKIGDKVFVKLNKLYMAEVNNVLTIGFPKGNTITEIEEEQVGSFIFNSGETFNIIPKDILISDIQNPTYKNTLVNVLNVQLVENEIGSAFAFFSGTNNGTRTLETCNESTKLTVFTSGEANFANELFPEGHGNIVGVLSTSLEVRSIDDVQFNEAHEICPVIIPKIMITEVADPKNSVASRFIELFNAGETTIDLAGWKLNKYVNGATTVSGSPIELNGITISAGDYIIIANTGFSEMFSIIPTIASSYISGNGDDVYELVDNTGTTMDIFGVIGEDGNGTNWEYLDGQAIRNLDVSQPNSVFTISEWTVFSDATNNLINYQNTPKNAPNDYSPNYR